LSTIHVSATFRPSSEPTIGRACHIATELAGYPLRQAIDGYELEIRFPQLLRPLPQGAYSGWMGESKDNPVGLTPSYFNVFATVDVPDDPASPERKSIFESVVAAMRVAATRLSDAIRLSQPSVGLVGESPEMLSIEGRDLGNDQSVELGASLKEGYPILIGAPLLTIEMAEEVLSEGPSVTHTLLAQATYLVSFTPSPQPGLAVLLAAVACEAHAKQVLLTRVVGTAQPLLEVFLRKPRIFQEPAVELFGEVAKAVIGKSLKDKDDDRDLWRTLVRLFEVRNRMAHVADGPSIEEARRLIRAARQAIEWLDAPQETIEKS
jgi:hypothetical protein